MFASAQKALALIFDPAFAGIVVKALLFTVVLFAVLVFGIEYLVQHQFQAAKLPWLRLMLEVLAPVLFVVLIVYAGPLVAAIFASFYLDDIAKAVEARFYAADGSAPGTPFVSAVRAGTRLAVTVVLFNIALLPFDIAIPFVGEIGALLVNGWLLGREYFELAALRHLPPDAVRALRTRHRSGVFFAGLLISVLSILPIANLFAPLFGSALMVHQFKRYAHEVP